MEKYKIIPSINFSNFSPSNLFKRKCFQSHYLETICHSDRLSIPRVNVNQFTFSAGTRLGNRSG